MDRCKYCKEYHNPTSVCDAYIEWLSKQSDKIKNVVKLKANNFRTKP